MTHIQKKYPIAKRFVVLLCIIVVLSILLLVYVYNQKITKMYVEGDIELSTEDIQNITDVQLPQKYIDINKKNIVHALEASPLIYTAKVKKTLFSTLVITLTRARPIVSILATVDNKTTPSYFDREGKCIQVGVQNGIVDVPILSGVVIKNPTPGVVLPSWLLSFIQQIDIIKKDNPSLFTKVSEFAIKREDTLTLVDIHFTDYAQYITSDLHIDADMLRKMYYFLSKVANIAKVQRFISFEIIEGSIVGRLEKDG